MTKKVDTGFLYKGIEIVNECELNYRVSRKKLLLFELGLIRLLQLFTTPQQKEGQKKKPVINTIIVNKPENNTASATSATVVVPKHVRPQNFTLQASQQQESPHTVVEKKEKDQSTTPLQQQARTNKPAVPIPTYSQTKNESDEKSTAITETNNARIQPAQLIN